MVDQNAHLPASEVPVVDMPKFQEGLVPLGSDYFYNISAWMWELSVEVDHFNRRLNLDGG